MKNIVKKEISDLISGDRSESKQEVLVLCEETPGIFSFRGQIVTEEEITELQKGYEKTVRFVHHN